MNIKFTNNESFEYVEAYALENDYYKDIKRPSLDIHFSTDIITYNKIEEILSNKDNLKEIILTGDGYPIYDINNIIVGYNEIPQKTYIGYDIPGRITIDDEIIMVKLFRKSDLEIENEEAMATIDELLIAMEV